MPLSKMTQTSKRMMLGFIKEKDTIITSFNQQGKKMLDIFCGTLVDKKTCQEVA